MTVPVFDKHSQIGVHIYLLKLPQNFSLQELIQWQIDWRHLQIESHIYDMQFPIG